MFYFLTKEKYDKLESLYLFHDNKYYVSLNQHGNQQDIATYNEKYGTVVITTVNNSTLENREAIDMKPPF